MRSKHDIHLCLFFYIFIKFREERIPATEKNIKTGKVVS